MNQAPVIPPTPATDGLMAAIGHSRLVLRIQDVRNVLDCSDEHVRHLVAEGLLEAVNIGLGGSRESLRISRESLLTFIRSRKVS